MKTVRLFPTDILNWTLILLYIEHSLTCIIQSFYITPSIKIILYGTLYVGTGTVIIAIHNTEIISVVLK